MKDKIPPGCTTKQINPELDDACVECCFNPCTPEHKKEYPCEPEYRVSQTDVVYIKIKSR